jgi:hypothetical protein
MLEAIAIYLLCAGGGAHEAGDGATVSATGRLGSRDEVQVEIVGDRGRIRVPDRLKPSRRSGGGDGWWKLTGLDIGEDEIRGRIPLNPIDRPRLRIDRLSGHISIRGRGGNFDGTCEPFVPSHARRKF